MSTRRVLLIALGQPHRGDEGLPAALLGCCRKMPAAERWWLSLIGDAQLQIEHALDLQLSDLAVFVQASTACEAPFSFAELPAPRGHRMLPMGDSLSPSDVLHTLATISRRDALPTCYRLEIRGESFEASDTLSDLARAHLDATQDFVETLLERPDPAYWQTFLSDRDPGTASCAG